LSNQAEAWYNQALALARDSNDLDHVYLWNYNLGSLYRRARRQLPKAFEYYEKAITALETLRRAIKRDDFSRSYGESKVFVYQDMVNTCLQIKSRREQAIDFVERGKGYTLMRIMDEANLQPSKKVPESLREEYVSLRENQLLGEAPHLNPTSPEDRIAPKPLEYRQKSQASLKKNYEGLAKSLHSIARYEPEFAEIFQPQRLRLDDIKEHLSQYDKKTALIEFFVTDEQTNVFIVDSKEWRMVTLPHFAERDLRRFLDENWLNPYRHYLDGYASLDDGMENIKGVGGKLFTAIWQPVQERLDQIKPARLLLVPHLGLHLLPLHLIPCSPNKEEPDYLSDRYEIAYTPSFRMQTYCRNKERMSRLQNSLFAVSNPDRSLEFAEIETTSISCRVDEVCVLHHEAATRQAVFDNAGQHNLIHFSTHGRGATLGTPLEAGLKMEGNKFLTVKEIFKELHLPESYAVVLSACETGMVQLDLGDEYIGLPAAFLYAGAPAVVSSLWSVEDISTALLIHRWYEHVLCDKMGRCAALMAAQKWLRNLAVDDIITELQKMANCVDAKIKAAKSENETEIFASQQKTIAETLKNYAALSTAYCPFDDPYYWGGFIVSGNPE
jgi:CHAT domain-containing protein